MRLNGLNYSRPKHCPCLLSCGWGDEWDTSFLKTSGKVQIKQTVVQLFKKQKPSLPVSFKMSLFQCTSWCLQSFTFWFSDWSDVSIGLMKQNLFCSKQMSHTASVSLTRLNLLLMRSTSGYLYQVFFPVISAAPFTAVARGLKLFPVSPFLPLMWFLFLVIYFLNCVTEMNVGQLVSQFAHLFNVSDLGVMWASCRSFLQFVLKDNVFVMKIKQKL